MNTVIYAKKMNIEILCILFLFGLFSCEFNNISQNKVGDSMQIHGEQQQVIEPVDGSDTDIIKAVKERKNISIGLLNKHFNFDSVYVKSMPYISGNSIREYDGIYIVFIDFDNSPCGERYLITLQKSALKEVSKLLVATYCDSDQDLLDHTVHYRFLNDSTFETKEMLYGEGKLIDDKKRANLVYTKEWLITKKGEITLVTSKESEQ